MKRKIEESSTEGGLESCNPSDPKASCPSYGSQHYWDERYQKNNSSDPKDRDQQKDENEDDETSPGFSWYFTYNELRPLLLPLVLGRGEEEEAWSDCDEEMEDILDDDGEDDEADEDSEIKNANEEEADSQEDNKDDGVDGDNSSNIDDEDIDGLEENENENSSIDDDERPDVEESFTFDPNRSPQTVLEIGCGDAPVGDELCRNVLQIQEKTKVDAKKMVDRIVCFDYSKTCIDFQQEKQRQEQKEQPTELNSKESTLRVDYKVHDARDLPYKDKEFNVIIDKGTLDAMLSDKVEGKNNCVKIISEAARTLAIEGYLLIVSHLNANGPEGLSWVDEVLAAGLKDGDSESSFRIEVHGNDAGDDDEQDGLKVKETEENEEDSKHYGPAVYIIQKKDNSQTKSAEECPRVDMKFFGY